jgi:hypothetical protein
MKIFSSPALWTQRPEYSEQALESHCFPCAPVPAPMVASAGKLDSTKDENRLWMGIREVNTCFHSFFSPLATTAYWQH